MGPTTNDRNVSVDSLLSNTFRMLPKKEFEELEENDRKRSGIKSDKTMSHGRKYNDGKNGKMNINSDVLPYDQTRVELRTPINGVDYVNASWIQKVKDGNLYDDIYNFLPTSKINFILTQDPTIDTQQHFYQMVFEQQIDLIVHIGSNNKLPPWTKRNFGNISLELVEVIKLEKYLARERIEIDVKQGRSVINHQTNVYHLTDWPTNGEFGYENSKKFLTMISHVQRDIGKPSKTFTIASHDSSGGVHGASTFFVLFQMVQELETKLNVRKSGLSNIERKQDVQYINIFERVNDLRKQRAHMISTFNNYKFLLTTLAYYTRNKSTFDKILNMEAPVAQEKSSFEEFESDSTYSDDDIPQMKSAYDEEYADEDELNLAETNRNYRPYSILSLK